MCFVANSSCKIEPDNVTDKDWWYAFVVDHNYCLLNTHTAPQLNETYFYFVTGAYSVYKMVHVKLNYHVKIDRK